MKRELARLLCALAILYFAIPGLAQLTSSHLRAGEQPRVVTIPFFVEDRHTPVGEITEADISILDDKKPPQSVVSIRSAKEQPLRLGILIDTSKSERTGGLYLPVVQAVQDFVSEALVGPDDKVFIMSFDTEAKGTGFMNRDEFLKLKVNLRTGGATALFDAVSLACKKSMRVDPAWPARRVLVILSDGGDNFSHITHDEAIAAAQSAGTVVFAISTSQNSGNDLDGKRLEQFGDKTGGHVFLHLSRADVAKDFSRIKDWIGHLYTITYIPVEQGENGKRRSVELRARGNRLKVHAPTAYFVPGGAE